MTSNQPKARHQRIALVIGGSLAGLLAARVLSEHFDRVIIVERDPAGAVAGAPSTVPQGRHTHVLLLRGGRIMEQLLPGLKAELLAAGALMPESGWDTLAFTPVGWTSRVHTGLSTYAVSRDLLDATIRQRVLALENVTALFGYEVTGLLANADSSAVAGVRLRRRPRAGERVGAVEELRADFVVDAAGRTSKSPEWLAGLGYQRPQESIVDAFVGYATRWYRRPEPAADDWKILMIQPNAPRVARAGVAIEVEHQQLAVTLMGAAHDYPPTDDQGFLEFARSLRDPMLYEVIKDAQPLTQVYGYRRTESRRLHYEHLERMPERLVVVGDAACGFNPVYGQGMTLAAMGVEVLDHELRAALARLSEQAFQGFGRRFQKRLAREIDPAWLLATSEDARYPTTEGTRATLAMRIMQRYMHHLQLIMLDSPVLYLTFLEVVNMIKPASALFHPAILLRVLRHTMVRPSVPARHALPASESTA